jgi:alkylation response protein AidB-like acyl-CoA dehydrogenase
LEKFAQFSMKWQDGFNDTIAQVGDGMSYQEAAERLRLLIKKEYLKITDIVERPDRFFEVHRLLGAHATRFGPGFWIRFTVHFNLFAGTVVALGTKEQLKALIARNQERPRLGCFGLTECLAGVNSGLVVETTAVYDDGNFIINTPSPGAAKNWISQGLVADEGVVVASLTVKGKNYGPQAFLVKFRDETTGELLPGIRAEDMGLKTVGNDLDNARLFFHNFKVPGEALLSRYLQIDSLGNVKQAKMKSMEIIGQRLFTGRIAVAWGAIQFSKTLFANVYEFARKKKCWAPNGRRPVLSDIPQIKDIFETGNERLDSISAFVRKVEAELSDCLRNEKIPPLKLQQAIAVCKVKAVEESISLCFSLKQEVGSYALQAGTGFEQLDFLQCTKFAEGDSRILMQKMARDLFRLGKGTPAENVVLEKLKEQMKVAVAKLGDNAAAWDSCWKTVYELANVHMDGILQTYGCQSMPAKL